MSKNAVNIYESLRKQVFEGAVRPQGLSVFLYHGMLRGLQILAQDLIKSEAFLTEKQELFPSPIDLDTNLVRLLANMILQLEVKHVY